MKTPEQILKYLELRKKELIKLRRQHNNRICVYVGEIDMLTGRLREVNKLIKFIKEK